MPEWLGVVCLTLSCVGLACIMYHHVQAKLLPLLQVLGPQQSTAKVLHDELRDLVLHTLVSSYNETGFLWENYDDSNGHGQGSHPFTGWTALLVLIAGQKYFSV